MTKTSKPKKKGPVRVSELSPGKSQAPKKNAAPPKKNTAGAAESAYRFVSQNLKGNPLEKITRTAFGILSEARKQVGSLLEMRNASPEERKRYAQLRKDWVKKRIKSTKVGRLIKK